MTKCVLLMGPTGCGKTQIAIKLANIIPLEIINVDSVVFYRDLNIGSAKPTTSELNAVAHHLVNIISPLEYYSVADFLEHAKRLINEIVGRGKLPLLVGGTMMYFNTLIHGLSVLPKASPKLRLELLDELYNKGNHYLHDKLANLDPVSAAKIAPKDSQRLLRALEVSLILNKPMSVAQKETTISGIGENYLPLAINVYDRIALREKLSLRFLNMLNQGLIDEVANLREHYPSLTAEHNSMRCIGYREVWQYLDSNIGFNDMTKKAISATCQLAKHQLTWLKKLSPQFINSQDSHISELFLLAKNKILRYI